MPTLRPNSRYTKGRGKSRRPSRRPAPPRWFKPALYVGGPMLALGLLFGGGLWLSRSDHASALGHWAADTIARVGAGFGLTVGEVLVQGRGESERDAVLTALGTARGASILAFDPQAAQQRLEQLPWVRKATVERRLPDTIFVAIEERRPMAIWQKDGQFALVDYDGRVIQRRGLERFRQLPLIVGDGAPQSAAALFGVLASEPDLRARVTAMTRVSDRRWTIKFDNGIELYLPEQDMGRAWAKFAMLERSQGLLNRDLSVIDLRLPDRMTVRLSESAARPKQESPRKRGKET